MSLVQKIQSEAVKKLWGTDISGLRRPGRLLLQLARAAYVSIAAYQDNQISLRAMGLVYTTILSLVPFLAFSFSVLKAFGVHNLLAPVLSSLLAPLGEKGPVVTNNIISYVNNLKVGVLGTVGLAALVYTIISVVQQIEGAFNYIWRVTETRSFRRRFSDYLSVILVGPVFIFTAMAVTSALMSSHMVQRILQFHRLGALIILVGKLVPFIFVSTAFVFIYALLPNTKVKPGAALFGGLFAGVLWQALGMAFAAFVATSSNYPAVYSGLAIGILFIVWLNLGWRIVLIGAEVSFHYQYPSLPPGSRQQTASGALRERLGLLVMYLIGKAYHEGRQPWSAEKLAGRLGLPPGMIKDIVDALRAGGLVMRAELEKWGDTEAFVPSRDLEKIKVLDVLKTTRDGDGGLGAIKTLGEPVVDYIISDAEGAIARATGEETIKDLLVSEEMLMTGTKSAT
jgi:membrane protein